MEPQATQTLMTQTIHHPEYNDSQSLDARINMLGIPEGQLTPHVYFALSALLEKLDDTSRDLERTKENLAELEHLVDVDCLAPIPNRRAFMRRLNWAISMHNRYAHPSSVLYFDLNDFKKLNDTYGHAAGDIAIKHVAQILSNTMRQSDFIARLGGDEFAIIMYHADEESAKRRGKKIADAICSTPFTFNGKALYLDVAVGLYSLQKGDSAEDALSKADFSMYVDKRKSKQGDIEAA